MSREYRNNQKSALVTLEALRLDGITLSHADFVAVFEDREMHLLQKSPETIDQTFAELREHLGERRIDELLYDLAVRIDEYRLTQRLASLEAALRGTGSGEPPASWLRRLLRL